MNKVKVNFRLNGRAFSLDVPPMARLLDILREGMGFTGTKEGCGEGECGACAVRVDGRLVNACLIPIVQMEGKDIETIEGIAHLDKLDPVQEYFHKYNGAQCGFCTPGMIMAVKNLLAENPKPTRDEIREAVSGNLCRCTGYKKIFDAVEALVKES